MKSEKEIRQRLGELEFSDVGGWEKVFRDEKIQMLDWVLKDSEPEEIKELGDFYTRGEQCGKINELARAVNKINKDASERI